MGALFGAGVFGLIFVGMVVAAFIIPGKITSHPTDRWGTRTGGDPVTRRNYWKIGIATTSVIPLLAAGAIFFFSGFHTVPAKSVGVVTQYGKVLNEYGPGGHWLFPTKSLNIVQDTKQSDQFLQSNGGSSDAYTPAGAVGNCIEIRLAGGNNGCADVRVQTQTDAAAVPQLFANYSSYGGNLTQDVDQYVVKTDLTTVLIRDLGDYNPIQDYSAQLEACDLTKASNCSSTVSQFSKFDTQLTSDLQAMLGNEATVYYVNLQNIHYDNTVESALAKIQIAYEDTAVATQQYFTNLATSKANGALTQSVTPQVLANECYTTTQDAIKANYALPTTWNCAGATNSGVIVSGK